MAQTKERTQPAAKSPPKTGQGTPAPAPKAVKAAKAPSTPPASVSPAPWQNWLSRLRGPLTNAPRPDGKPQQQRARGSIFKSFFGILIWFVASQFIMYGLILLDSALPRVNGLPLLESTHLLPTNTPLLGWITPFLLLYGGSVIGLWFLLIRFNLIPRDFFGARAQAQERARRQSQGATTTGASTGPRKTRTQRRHAEAVTQTQANAKNSAKGGKATAKPVAKTPNTPAKPAKPAKPATNAPAPTHDDEYEQVRAADRQRRRRVSKR